MAHSDNDSGNEGTSNRRRVPTREERENLPYPPDPPRYAWYRPRMQGFPARLNLYVRDIVVEQIPIVLKRVGGEELLQRFKDGPFLYLLDIKRNGTANVALHELLARELTDPSFSEFERWFHVGGRDIHFVAQEFCLVTGLLFGPSEFDPNRGAHVIPPTSLFYTMYNGQKTKDKTLLKDFMNPQIIMGTPDQYLSAVNLLMYYYMLLCRDDQTIEPWAWALVEDQDEWTRFPWGSWSFQVMCRQLGVMKKDPTEIGGPTGAYHLYGPVWALNLWSYEAIMSLGRACGYRLNEISTPRLLRWHTRQSHLDFTRFFDDDELEALPTLEPKPQIEIVELYMLTLGQGGPLSLKFNPNQRHTHKKLPPQQRQLRAAREMAKVVQKLKYRDAKDVVQPGHHKQPRAARASSETRGHFPERSEVDIPESSRAKRPREEPSHAEQPEQLVCCVHGDPCHRGCGNDDWIDKVLERVVHRLAEDTSEKGILARMAKSLFGHLKGMVGSKSSSL